MALLLKWKKIIPFIQQMPIFTINKFCRQGSQNASSTIVMKKKERAVDDIYFFCFCNIRSYLKHQLRIHSHQSFAFLLWIYVSFLPIESDSDFFNVLLHKDWIILEGLHSTSSFILLFFQQSLFCYCKQLCAQ